MSKIIIMRYLDSLSRENNGKLNFPGKNDLQAPGMKELSNVTRTFQ